MADPKPGDFFLGATEFLAVLVPGAAAIYLVQPLVAPFVPNQLRPPDGPERWIAFLVLAYALGHMLHAGVSSLDKRIYDHWYLKQYQPDHYRAVRLVAKDGIAALAGDAKAVNTLYARVVSQVGHDATGTSRYDWCLSFIHTQSAAAAQEVDRYQANSKLFRSLAVVFGLAALVTAGYGAWGTAAVSLLLVPLAIYRYCSLRWDATKRLYEYYLLLHKYPGKNSEVSPSAASLKKHLGGD